MFKFLLIKVASRKASNFIKKDSNTDILLNSQKFKSNRYAFFWT